MANQVGCSLKHLTPNTNWKQNSTKTHSACNLVDTAFNNINFLCPSYYLKNSEYFLIKKNNMTPIIAFLKFKNI